MAPRLETIEQWVAMLREADLPVLGRTVSELKRLQEDDAGTTPQRVADAVLHDPFMTVKVLLFLQEHRSRRRSAEITTIPHALMMLGLTPFFACFGNQTSIEERLGDEPASLRGVRAVMSRARHAALYVRDWAKLRHDVDPEEVIVAALLHDMAEMLLWCYAPQMALEIERRQLLDPALRSDRAQREVVGFRLIDLQLAMVKAWELPDLLHVLIDEDHARNPRAISVALGAAVARHSARGWDNPALPDDFEGIGRLLSMSDHTARERVIDIAVQAIAEEPWYGVPAAARQLPFAGDSADPAYFPGETGPAAQ